MAKRGRVKLEINKEEFQQVVNRLESSFSFLSQRELWKAVAASEWARTQKPRPLTAQVAALRAKALGITVRTPRGRRYDIARHHTNTPHRRRSIDAGAIAALRRETPDSLHSRVDKVANGSLSSAIALKCLECCAYEKSEVRECTSKGCPLWNFRPYQQKKENACT